MKSLMGSITANNLINEFRRKTYNQQKYTNHGAIAMQEEYLEIRDMFRNMAKNVNEHARLIANFLICNGYKASDICVLKQIPVYCSNTLKNLQTTAREEDINAWSIFPNYIDMAFDEGYLEVGIMLKHMKKVSENYANTCDNIQYMISNDKYLKRDNIRNWICSRCGYVYSGYEAPSICPLCTKKTNHFRLEKEY